MTRVGSVASAWRYPAKSMMGDEFPSLRVGEGGIAGDRGWAVRDEVRGGIRGAKKIGELMQLHATYVAEPAAQPPVPPIEIRFPDGSVARSDDDDVNDRLSEFLDHAVTLWPLQPVSDLDHYRRGAPDTDDSLAELRAIFGRDPDEPLPTFEGLPLDVLIEYESPPGSYFFDAFPILVVTDRSLATLAEFAPDSAFDVRRFRPNVVVALDEPDGPCPEQEWVGRRLRVGEVELDVTAPLPTVRHGHEGLRRPPARPTGAAHGREAGQPERRGVRHRGDAGHPQRRRQRGAGLTRPAFTRMG